MPPVGDAEQRVVNPPHRAEQATKGAVLPIEASAVSPDSRRAVSRRMVWRNARVTKSSSVERSPMRSAAGDGSDDAEQR